MARHGLNTAKVVGEAAVLIDEVGFGSLSLAALAARLDVRVPSLYKHIGGLDDLRERLAELSREELYATIEATICEATGPEALRAACDAYRAYANAHPGRFGASAWFVGTGSAVSRIAPLIEQIVRECGVSEARVGPAATALGVAMRGYQLVAGLGAYRSQEVANSTYEVLLDIFVQGMTAQRTEQVRLLDWCPSR